MIEVILLERIERLGHLGDVVRVRPGFARNFLLPHKKALRATKANLALFEKQKSELEAKNAADRKNAEALAAKISDLKLIVIRQASEMGQLFGSVGSRDVALAAQEAGHEIQRMQVQIDKPIKELGLFPVKVKLHPEVSVKVIVNVARSTEEAHVQAEKGKAIQRAEAKALEEQATLEGPVNQDNEPVEEAKPKATKKKAKAAPAAETPEAEAKPAASKKAEEEKPKKAKKSSK